MDSVEFIFGYRSMGWEPEHSFQEAAYCYDQFVLTSDGRTEIAYWAGLEHPFESTIRQDADQYARLTLIEFPLEPHDARILRDAIRNTDCNIGATRYFNTLADRHPEYYIYLNQAAGVAEIHSFGVVAPIADIVSAVREISKHAAGKIKPRAQSNVNAIKRLQYSWQLDLDLPATTETGEIVIPSSILANRDPIL